MKNTAHTILQLLNEINESLAENNRLLRLTAIVGKPVLTLKEAAAYAGLSEGCLYKLTSTNVIPHSKPNGKVIFFETQKLNEWLLSRPAKTMKEIKEAATAHVLRKQL